MLEQEEAQATICVPHNGQKERFYTSPVLTQGWPVGGGRTSPNGRSPEGVGRTRPFPKPLSMVLPSTTHLWFNSGVLRSQGRWHMPITLTHEAEEGGS